MPSSDWATEKRLLVESAELGYGVALYDLWRKYTRDDLGAIRINGRVYEKSELQPMAVACTIKGLEANADDEWGWNALYWLEAGPYSVGGQQWSRQECLDKCRALENR